MNVGDKVICPFKPESLYYEEPGWNPDMDKRAGTIGTIVSIDARKRCKVVFDDGDYWWYAARWFNEYKNFDLNELILLL